MRANERALAGTQESLSSSSLVLNDARSLTPRTLQERSPDFQQQTGKTAVPTKKGDN